MSRTTYSLEEVAEQHLPAAWSDAVRWLARRLNRGELSGYRVGRTWRMTDQDVDYLITRHHNAVRTTVSEMPAPEAAPTLNFVEGLSDRSRARLRRRSA